MKMKDTPALSATFSHWATEYFSPASGERRLDIMIPLKDALADYRRASGRRETTSNTFRQRLEKWAEECPYIYELNPCVLCVVKPTPGRHNGRILRRLHNRDGSATGPFVDHIYMRSKPVLSSSAESD